MTNLILAIDFIGKACQLLLLSLVSLVTTTPVRTSEYLHTSVLHIILTGLNTQHAECLPLPVVVLGGIPTSLLGIKLIVISVSTHVSEHAKQEETVT